MKKAFTLAELLIVVAILGILGAVVLPILRGHIAEAKEAAAKDNLRILRNAIEYYAVQNNGIPPGYPQNDPSRPALSLAFLMQMITNGHYLPEMPENPFNNSSIIKVLLDGVEFPAAATGANGWIYKPATKTIKIDWPGTDSKGVEYFDY